MLSFKLTAAQRSNRDSSLELCSSRVSLGCSVFHFFLIFETHIYFGVSIGMKKILADELKIRPRRLKKKRVKMLI